MDGRMCDGATETNYRCQWRSRQISECHRLITVLSSVLCGWEDDDVMRRECVMEFGELNTFLAALRKQTEVADGSPR